MKGRTMRQTPRGLPPDLERRSDGPLKVYHARGVPLKMRRIPVSPGEQYGRLTIVAEVPSSTRRRMRCICQCGATLDVTLDSLRRCHTLSCGCLRDELASQDNFV